MPIAFNIEALYTKKSWKHNFDDNGEVFASLIMSYYYFCFPVTVRYAPSLTFDNVLLKNIRSLYIETGFEPSKYSCRRYKEKDDENRVSVSQVKATSFLNGFIAGGGIRFGTPWRDMEFGFRYVKGLTEIIDAVYDKDKLRINSLQFTLTAYVR